MNASQELNNLKYKTTIFNSISNSDAYSSANMDKFLEREISFNKLETWGKLDKTVKIEKMNKYIDELIQKYNLSIDEISSLKEYLIACIDKKNLQKVKDIVYDKESGLIKNIPALDFNNTTRKFVLKRDKHVSTIKSLAPKKKLQIKELDELDELDEFDKINIDIL